jgi:hypothetical protein
MVGKGKMFVYVGIIAVCYLSSLMNLIIDGGGSVRRKKKPSTADQYNNEGREDRISSFLFFSPSSPSNRI